MKHSPIDSYSYSFLNVAHKGLMSLLNEVHDTVKTLSLHDRAKESIAFRIGIIKKSGSGGCLEMSQGFVGPSSHRIEMSESVSTLTITDITTFKLVG